MTTTITQQINKLESLVLRGDDEKPVQPKEVGTPVDEANKDYKYAKYLPYRHDDGVRYPPTKEYKHIDPGLEALKHDNPREFLEGATVTPVSTPSHLDGKGDCI
jgi:sulfonate dioxygenase